MDPFCAITVREMPVRLFVAKLPFTATEADVREYFSQVGSISGVILPTDRETGKKRGFAFVDVDDQATAEEAIRSFNNGVFQGRTIAVSEARPREERRPGAPPSRPHAGGPPRDRLGGGGTGRFSGEGSEGRGDYGKGRASRRPHGGKKGGRQETSTVSRGPIPERRSGRLHDLEEEGRDDKDIEFDNFATSAPPGEEDSDE